MIRWIACVFGIVAATIHASAVISLQWLGWLICLVSISLWLFIAYKDKDTARATMQFYFLIIAIIAVYNWLKHI